MSEQFDRYDRIAREFTARVDAVPADRWNSPAPCDGWVARDVVRHLVEWVPSIAFQGDEVPTLSAPSVDEDPVGAWHALDDALRHVLSDPELAVTPIQAGPMPAQPRQDLINQIVTNDVFMHTWDLARATGLDETLLADEVDEMLDGMLPMDEMLRSSGHYGPRVAVPDEADEQTKLLAFIGRSVG